MIVHLKMKDATLREVADYAEASAYLRSEQERVGYQGPEDSTEWPRGGTISAFIGGPVLGRISQNGRVWDTSDSLLYSPF